MGTSLSMVSDKESIFPSALLGGSGGLPVSQSTTQELGGESAPRAHFWPCFPKQCVCLNDLLLEIPSLKTSS